MSNKTCKYVTASFSPGTLAALGMWPQENAGKRLTFLFVLNADSLAMKWGRLLSPVIINAILSQARVSPIGIPAPRESWPTWSVPCRGKKLREGGPVYPLDSFIAGGHPSKIIGNERQPRRWHWASVQIKDVTSDIGKHVQGTAIDTALLLKYADECRHKW